jgi:hypothetical protein
MEGLCWHTDNHGKARLGIQIDVNTYKEHKCVSKEESPNKIVITHDWCYKCGVSIDLRFPCEHFKPKPKVDTIEPKKGSLLDYC